MEKNNKFIIKCPLCKEEGKPCDNNKIVWFHTFKTPRGNMETHKWSCLTGRMFTLKPTEDDSIW